MICNVLEYLERACEETPDKRVIGDIREELTYREFLHMARAAGSVLIRAGRRREPVGVLIDRDVYSVMAFMGIVCAGCAYVPIDRSLPKERIETILSVTAPGLLLIHRKDRELAEALSFPGRLLEIESLSKGEVSPGLLAEVREKHLDTDPLYILFTSGSTGIPKGVVVSHRSVIDLAEQFQKVFAFVPEDVFANQAPFDFDVSVKDWYLALRCGGTMQIVPRSMFVMPKGLIPYLKERKASVLIWAASALGVVAGFCALQKADIPMLRKVMFSGEVLPVKVLHYWQEHLPGVQFANLYGPTEITCNCTYYIVNREFSENEVLPIGKAFPNTEVLLLDPEGREVSAGETGEICVRGSSLALGYYGQEEATRAAFCQHPGRNAYRELIYCTGDLGYRNGRGELVFASRKDSQIKHMGHRIELGEIEAAGNGLAGIEKCCCLYDREGGKIILIYQSRSGQDRNVLEGIQKKLPKYMCPNRLVHMEQIPMNSHDKMDRARLKRQFAEGRNEQDEN